MKKNLKHESSHDMKLNTILRLIMDSKISLQVCLIPEINKFTMYPKTGLPD